MTRGTLIVHSATRALAPHIEWAVNGVLDAPVRLAWRPQPAAPHLVRTQIGWHGPSGTGARLATALRGWDSLRFEVTEEASAAEAGSRWMCTPALGIHHASMDAEGNATLTEDRIRHCLALGAGSAARIADELGKALGEAWDLELEHFREGSDSDAQHRLMLVTSA